MLKEYKTILLDEVDSVAILKLNRPEKLNAFNMQMFDDMLDAIDFVNKNSKIPVEDMKVINFDKIKKRFRKSAVRYQSEPFRKSYKSQEIKGKFF